MRLHLALTLHLLVEPLFQLIHLHNTMELLNDAAAVQVVMHRVLS